MTKGLRTIGVTIALLTASVGVAQKPDSKGCWPGQEFSKKKGKCLGTPRCPSGLVVEGTGCAARKKTEVEWVSLEGFALTKTEVTTAQYEQCVIAGRCTEPNTWPSACNWKQVGREGHPINCVNFEQASAFCTWAGGRLPTAAEWLRAATNARDDKYPWGNEKPTRELVHFGYRADGLPGTAEAGSHPKGANANGVLDLAGSVWEWTSDIVDEQRQTLGGIRPMGDDEDVVASSHLEMSDANQGANVGIRCAK